MTFLDWLDQVGLFALVFGSLCVSLAWIDPYARPSGRHRARR